MLRPVFSVGVVRFLVGVRSALPGLEIYFQLAEQVVLNLFVYGLLHRLVAGLVLLHIVDGDAGILAQPLVQVLGCLAFEVHLRSVYKELHADHKTGLLTTNKG